MSVFARFHPRLQETIVSRLGFTALRPVQEQAGAVLLDGHNAVVLAPTAGGKTEAAIFPTLSMLLEEEPRGVGALYVAPIKALLNNQSERLDRYASMVGLSRFVWHGDTRTAARDAFLREPASLLMTTPESLEVMLISQRVDAGALFRDLRIVVIDEVHAFAGTDRGGHLMSVIERLAALSGRDLQRVGLSATVGNPDAILEWLRGTSKRAGRVVDPPKAPAPRELLVVHRPDKDALARDAAAMARGKKSLFFVQSRTMAETVADQMRRYGTAVYVHHSAVSREEREEAEARFHHGSDACIVCTSTLELGIDVGDLDRVFQAEAPETVSSFLQRMGRTGRREGQKANTTFFCETTDGVLQAFALIDLAKSRWVEDVGVQTRCWPVLVHQLFAMALADAGIPPEDAWAHLSRVPDLAGIHRAEFDRLVAWLIRDRSLVLTSGRLVLGPRAEARFGRKNFMDLYAVFTSPQSYRVETASGQAIGTLQQQFVDRLVEGVSSFLLAGRAWAVTQLRHDDRIVRVQPAPRGKVTTWGGYLPQFVSFPIAQRIRAVLGREDVPAWLDPGAAEVLRQQREAFGEVLAAPLALEEDEGEVRWWTFAGGRVNYTLKHALLAAGGDWKVVPDNFVVKIRGEGIRADDVREAIARISEFEFWEDDRLWADVAAELPGYRLSKFQPVLPAWVQREMVATYLLDVETTWRWLSRGDARTPGGLRAAIAAAPEVEPAVTEPIPAEPRGAAPSAPVRIVRTAEALDALCAELASHSVVAVDVETELRSRSLCLVQLAVDGWNAIVDPLEIADLAPLGRILADPAITKVAHNASFERSVLARLDIDLVNVFDTLEASRKHRGRKLDGGHSLRAVCKRELGIEVDKTEQTSDWTRRPLTESQLRYAALDAEVLVALHRVFAGLPDPNLALPL